MNAIFEDMQDDQNEKNGSCIADAASLDALLRSFTGRKPFCFLLKGENGSAVTVGWGPRLGSVQFGPSTGAPPYQMATAEDAFDDDEAVEFLAGDTPTPIPRRFCMPIEKVKCVVLDFLRDGQKSPGVAWEEI